MSQPVVTCHVNDTLNVAAQKMWEHDCGVVPVVDDAGRLVGIVTDRDVCMAAYTTGAPLGAIAVAQAMAREVLACHAEEGVDATSRRMRDAQVRRLPVVDDDNRPIGMLSVNDVVRSAGVARKAKGFEAELVQTLAKICEPRRSVALAKPRRTRRTAAASARA
jgi:CBS domain-containing protein